MSSRVKINLTDQHLAVIKEYFNLLDSDKDGQIDKLQFGTLFRALGQTINDKELAKLTEDTFNKLPAEEDTDSSRGARGIGLSDFINAFINNYSMPVNEDVLTEGFQLFDQENTGYISTSTLRDIVSSRGEPIAEKELNELLMLSNVDVEKNSIDYTNLAQKLCAGPEGIRSLN